MQWESSGQRYIAIEDLRRIFQIEAKQYSRFADLKRWVLEPSVSELNKKTELKIQYKIVKTGRKITSISFSFPREKEGDRSERCPDTMDMFEIA